MKDDTLRLYHHQAIEVWENFCRLHKSLLDLTCEEYEALLSGEVEQIESILPRKEAVMAEISQWDATRVALITSLNDSGAADQPVTSVTQLLRVLKSAEARLGVPALANLNALLIDIITKTQEQNKRNQLFLNKAMNNLREIREGFSGKKKTYTTYGADGLTRSAGR